MRKSSGIQVSEQIDIGFLRIPLTEKRGKVTILEVPTDRSVSSAAFLHPSTPDVEE